MVEGIPIGNVRKVALEPEDPTQVHVTIEVRKDAAIRSDSIASLDVSLVFGDATITITGGSESAPPLADFAGPRLSDHRLAPSSGRDLGHGPRPADDRGLGHAHQDAGREQSSGDFQASLQAASSNALGTRREQTQDFGLMLDGAAAAIRDVDASDVAFRARLAEMRQALATAQADVDDVSAIVKMVDGWVP